MALCIKRINVGSMERNRDETREKTNVADAYLIQAYIGHNEEHVCGKKPRYNSYLDTHSEEDGHGYLEETVNKYECIGAES